MFSSSLSRRPAAVARTAAVTGLALAAFALGAGTASAAQAASPETAAAGQLPGHAADRVCTGPEAVLGQLSLPAPASVPVCKLVNGWD
ncbi:hypothetical protein [Streptomyces sp. NPDC014734]|uniref:hypothetical protein n=1 Tax=Streptomyces sp. NPDC014734 TaxID=3364886 RepID=UPI0036F65B8E